MRFRSITLTCAAIFLAFGLFACYGYWGFDLGDYKYRFEDSFAADLEGAETVSIKIRNGSINITTWDQQRVEIKVDERIKAGNEEEARELAEEVKFVGITEGKELKIEPDFGKFVELRSNYYSDLEVKLPRSVSLHLETHNGRVIIPEMDGDLYVETHNGKIEIGGCAGDAELYTHNGKIVTGEIGGDITAVTHNGVVELTGSKSIEAKSHNGSVTITLDPNSGYEIDADTHNGSVEYELSGERFKAGRVSKKSLTGTYGNGEYRVSVTTHNGAVRIKDD